MNDRLQGLKVIPRDVEVPGKQSRFERFVDWVSHHETIMGTSLSILLAGIIIFGYVLPDGLSQVVLPAVSVGEVFGATPVKDSLLDGALALVVLTLLRLFRSLPQPRLYSLATYRTPQKRKWLEIGFIVAVLVVAHEASSKLGKLGLNLTGQTEILEIEVPLYRSVTLSVRAGLLEDFVYIAVPVALVSTVALLVTSLTRKRARWTKAVTGGLLALSLASLLAGHVYQGLGGLPGHAVWIIAHGVLYLIFRRLWPLVFFHIAWDLKAGGIIPSNDVAEAILTVLCLALAIRIGQKLFQLRQATIQISAAS